VAIRREIWIRLGEPGLNERTRRRSPDIGIAKMSLAVSGRCSTNTNAWSLGDHAAANLRLGLVTSGSAGPLPSAGFTKRFSFPPAADP
jgi:hypothetical protein